MSPNTPRLRIAVPLIVLEVDLQLPTADGKLFAKQLLVYKGAYKLPSCR
jgi:hypothetical protein